MVSSVNRRCRIALFAAVTATPLVIVPGLFLRYFTTPKIAVLYVAAALLLVSLDAWWSGLKMLARTRWGAVVCASLLAEVASLLLSAALSNQPVLALAGTTDTRLGAITQIVAMIIAAALAGYVILQRAFAKRVLVAMELAAAIAALYGIAQYLGWDPLLSRELYTDHIPEAMIRPPATFGQATYFATFLLPGTLIAASAAMDASTRRWLHAIVFGCCTLAIVFTGTRSALLGLALGGLILAYTRTRFADSNPRFKYLAATSAVLALAVGLLALAPLGQSFRVRLSQWAQDPAGGTRLLVWHDSLRLVREHPFTGIGPATFTGEFRRIQSLELSRKYPDRYHEDPHNLLLGTAVAQGVPGLAALLVLTYYAFVCGFRRRQGSGISGTLVAALAAITLALQFTPVTGPNWLYFVALIALLVSTSTDRVPMQRPKPLLKSERILAICSAVVLLAIATAFALQDAAVASTGRWAANGDLDRVRESYRLSSLLRLPSDDLWCSQQIAAMARRSPPPLREATLDLAKAASAQAEHNSEMGFIALVQSAALNGITGDDRSAEEKLVLAARAAPRWYKPHSLLATILSAGGRVEEAKRERDLALTLLK